MYTDSTLSNKISFCCQKLCTALISNNTSFFSVPEVQCEAIHAQNNLNKSPESRTIGQTHEKPSAQQDHTKHLIIIEN